MSAEPVIVGIKPWLPPPFSTSAWWTVPIAAERLAAVRIGVGLTLVFDVLTTYLPRAADFFGVGSVTDTAAFAHPLAVSHRLLLLPIDDPIVWNAILIAWALAGVLLAVGFLARFAAAFAWFLSMSLVAMNPMLHNAGDQVRTILLLMMMVSPCDAVWSLRRSRGAGVLIDPWAIRLLTVQMAVIYFMNGLFKSLGDDWRSGEALVTLLGDSGWMRFSIADWNAQVWALRVSCWLVILWELGFPVLIRFAWTRPWTLALGVVFHVGTGLTMRVGMFPEYMLCLYLMFVPWERFTKRESRSGILQSTTAPR